MMDVAILCGGKGTRLNLPDLPKPMADINGKPFLEILIDYIASFGFSRFVLCAGFRADKIRWHFRNNRNVIVSVESVPLGTAGGFKHAQPFFHSKTILVFNGDSICPIDLKEFIKAHEASGSLVTMAVKKMDYKLHINAGIYAVERSVLGSIPSNKPTSFEKDIFPSLVGLGLQSYKTTAKLHDIGTPESLDEFRKSI